MEEVRERLEQELRRVMDRLHQPEGAMVMEEFPGAAADNGPSTDPWEDVQVHGEQEVSFATRYLLIQRASRLAEALQRLGEGTYGTCAECGEPVGWARLRAIPEVTTCVRCQDRLERLAGRREAQGMAG